LEGTGTGAGEAYAWAISNPEHVSTIFSVNPQLRSLQTKTALFDRLDTLVHAGISLINVCGSLDPLLKENTLAMEKRYAELGGKMKVIIHEGQGHFVSDPDDPKKVIDFILQNNLQ
jgi:hypothetical protein